MSFFTITRASASSSAFEYAAPVGLEGLFSTKSFVFFVIAFSSCAGVILNPVDCFASTITGVASARSAMSG